MDELNPIVMLGISILSIVITAVIFRAFFDVRKRLWIQQKQLDITIKIAEKQGVTAEEIQAILKA